MNELEKILGVTFPNNTVITNATNTTKKVEKNSIFFGLQGTKVHGSKYIEEAIELGASVAVHDDPNFKINNKDLENKIFYIKDIDKRWSEVDEINDYPGTTLTYNEFEEECYDNADGVNRCDIYNKLLLFLCELNSDCKFVNSRGIIPVINGFTGTNGKTTSAYMASQLGAKVHYSERSAFSIYIGTLGFQYSYYHYTKNKAINTNFDTSLSNNTTPDIFEIFEILKKISDEISIEYIDELFNDKQLLRINIELSSHALDQGRLKYIPFDNVALMNIGSDHLDYHKNLYEYEKSKLKIFDLVHKGGQKYIGIDSINIKSRAFKEYFTNQEKPQTISFKDKSANFYCQINKPTDINQENTFKIIKNTNFERHQFFRSARNPLTGEQIGGISLVSSHSDEEVFINNKKSDYYTNLLKEKGHIFIKEDLGFVTIKTLKSDRDYICKIFPEYNIENLVFSLALTLNSLTDVTALIFYDFEDSDVLFTEYRDREFDYMNYGHRVPIILNDRVQLPPGRAELISDIPANIIIDYAHNSEGFNLFLSSIKHSFQKLVVIFGCGGNRDKEKRPQMLGAAIQYGDKIIFTSDNSRNEKFKDIFNDAAKGNDIKDVLIIENRKEAIIHGTKLIDKNDCLVILGKGHEETQEINGKITHFSDYEVVHEIYK